MPPFCGTGSAIMASVDISAKTFLLEIRSWATSNNCQCQICFAYIFVSINIRHFAEGNVGWHQPSYISPWNIRHFKKIHYTREQKDLPKFVRISGKQPYPPSLVPTRTEKVFAREYR
jgi:hypothetical protein